MTRKRLGFFTRVLDAGGPAIRYQAALEQIQTAEAEGFDGAWVAQHHFHEDEGGLPSPFVLLAHAAALTSRISLGTAIITLPLEQPVRVAEDAVVTDILSRGRLRLGFGSGGTASSFPTFGRTIEERRETYEANLALVTAALAGDDIGGTGNTLYPASHGLQHRVWEATFSARGAAGIGRRGNALMLSRMQPPTPETAGQTLSEIQNHIIDEYLRALPSDVAPRILASRTAFVADDPDEARHWAAIGLSRLRQAQAAGGRELAAGGLDEIIAATSTHLGTPEQVVESLARDRSLDRADEVTFQVHSVDPPHDLVLRHIELLARDVAPQLGWTSEVRADSLSGRT